MFFNPLFIFFVVLKKKNQTFSCTKFCFLEFHWSELHVIEQNQLTNLLL